MDDFWQDPGDPPGLASYQHEGRTIHVPLLSQGEIHGSEWRYRPYGVVEDHIWVEIGAVAIDITRTAPLPAGGP